MWSEIAGWVVVVTAVTLDLLGLWPQWTFVPNLTNIVRGFLIGVPVALVLFTTPHQRARRTTSWSGCPVARGTTSPIESGLSARNTRMQALEHAELDLGELWRTIRQEMLDAIGQDVSKAIVHLPKDDAWDAFKSRMEQWCQQLTTQYGSIKIPRAGTLEMEWLAIRRSWTVLDVSVKTQRFQADNRGWLTDDVDIRLQHKLDKGGNPLSQFSDIHDRQGPDKENPPMGNVPHWICKYSRGTRQELAQQVAGAPILSPPYTLNADHYVNAAVLARAFLEELRGTVDAAEDVDGWPGSCRRS